MPPSSRRESEFFPRPIKTARPEKRRHYIIFYLKKTESCYDGRAANAESGTAITDAPGTKGLGTLTSGELESSNVDLATELVDLIVAQRDFNANSKSITAGKEMIQTVINI